MEKQKQNRPEAAQNKENTKNKKPCKGDCKDDK